MPSVNNLSCTLSIPFGPSTRDASLEADLQDRLDRGHRVFAVGDVHGHLATFRALLHRLQLGPEDRVVCLGDMIDRGPNSAGVVDLLRSHNQVVCIKGNHEHMACQSVNSDGAFEAWSPWMKRGGKSTYGSYIVATEGDLYEARARMRDDFIWLDSLPTQIVLDRHRLVHAGYDPGIPMHMQGEKEMLWIRKTWYKHDAPLDAQRSVFFGHTTTTKLSQFAGEVAFSEHVLRDGRPAWACLDVGAYNHVAPGIAAINIATLRTIKQPTLRCDRWFDHRADGRGRSGTWRVEDGRKEALVADSFGLRALANRTRRASIAEQNALRELEQAGLMPSQTLEPTDGGHEVNWKKGSHRLAGPTSFRIYRRRQESVRASHHTLSPFGRSVREGESV
ncbi:MAG: serine/threonine protein phosphatase [Candidatus Poseidoniales archaeon]|nr:MAG: serine/threonine protein phosphatase [Candidatus Poseidoniales archaeon]